MSAVEAEVAAMGASFLQHAWVNHEIVAAENEQALYASRNEALEAQIAARRDAQAKVFRFVNQRLEENCNVIRSLEATIDEAEANFDSSRSNFEKAEAEAAAACAVSLLQIKEETAECEAEIAALETFARGRDALKADLVALDAMRAAVERETAEVREKHQVDLDRDRQTLQREAALKATAARQASLAKAAAGLDPATRRRVAEHRKICAELDVQKHEIERLEAATADKRDAIARLRRDLTTTRRDHEATAKLARVRRLVQAGRVDDGPRGVHDEDASSLPQKPLISERQMQLIHLRAARERQVKETRKAHLAVERMCALQSPEVLALLATANDMLPAAGVEHWRHVAGLAPAVVDEFLDRVFARLRDGSTDSTSSRKVKADQGDDDSEEEGLALSPKPASSAATIPSPAKTDGTTVQLPRISPPPSPLSWGRHRHHHYKGTQAGVEERGPF